jgi:uncharacterized protein involved in exopolysaccharide biosynthesis
MPATHVNTMIRSPASAGRVLVALVLAWVVAGTATLVTTPKYVATSSVLVDMAE